MALTKSKMTALQNGRKSALKRSKLYKEQYEKYAPSVMSVASTAAGGAIAGAVNSGRLLPAQLGGFSTPLIVGGLLSAYAIYASGDAKEDNDNMASLAAGLGGGMIAVWAASYTENMLLSAGADNEQPTQLFS
jgi:hypothetical protein